MMADKAYQATAAQHRGALTEAFAARRLASVFGMERVHSNVHLAQSKGTTIGEIDVLVVFGDRLIIVQAKSKRLTLEARRGNDGQLRKDFAAAIQDSYDQAWLCAQAILAGDGRLLDATSCRRPPWLKRSTHVAAPAVERAKVNPPPSDFATATPARTHLRI
ncbi:nuclease-related domain-containing protein [Paraburkholderia sp. RAU2J]|uniref:NERD domain-containing protein n=1 Tax=Paraburkholderia sp. RAU2J TaxID=1938810 RepID=UPI000EAF9F0C